MTKKWWHDKVVYQIYPKSFADSNGDGIGDIPGIISRLDYLQDLGVDMLWLSPCYSSPLADEGYDISDYYNIDPRFGTMEDMEQLIAEARKRNMYILMDLVVNHCSDEHEWFRKACEDPDGTYGRYFLPAQKIRQRAACKLAFLLRRPGMGRPSGHRQAVPACVSQKTAGLKLGKSTAARRSIQKHLLVAGKGIGRLPH